MIGCVVVGVGMAGRVRIRDLLAPLPSSGAESFSLKGFVSRRTLQEQDVQQVTLEEALSRSDVQAVFVCTENSTHEEYIRRSLEAGKHVCVEYPMTLSYRAAADLWDLAEQKGLVLHEEHIELLTPEFRRLKEDVAGLRLEEGSLHFTGGPVKSGSGFPSFSGIARLTWLVDLFGELSVRAATMDEDPERKRAKMTAHLLTKDQKPLTWTEEHAEGLARAKRVHLRFTTRTVAELPAGVRDPVGLFMQDLVRFGHEVGGAVPTEELRGERRRILHCLRLAETIGELCRGAAPSLMV